MLAWASVPPHYLRWLLSLLVALVSCPLSCSTRAGVGKSSWAVATPPNRAPMRFCGRPRALQDQHASARRAWNTHLGGGVVRVGRAPDASIRQEVGSWATHFSFLSLRRFRPPMFLLRLRLRLSLQPRLRGAQMQNNRACRYLNLVIKK